MLWHTAITLFILISRDGHRFMQCQNPLTGHWRLVMSHTIIMLSNHLSYPFIKAIALVAIGFKMLAISIIFWPLGLAWNHFITCLYWDKFTRITICANMTITTNSVIKIKIKNSMSCCNSMPCGRGIQPKIHHGLISYRVYNISKRLFLKVWGKSC